MTKRRQTNQNTKNRLAEAANALNLSPNVVVDKDGRIRELEDERAELKSRIEKLESDGVPADDKELVEVYAQLDNLRQTLSTAIVRVDEQTLAFQRVRLHRSYAELPEDISEDEIEDLGYALIDLGQNINFWLGDLVLWYFNKRGAQSAEEKSKIYEELEKKFGKSHSVLKNAVWIAGNVPASTRVDAPLTFTHYRTIVSATDSYEKVYKWAVKAYEQGWSDRELKKQLEDAYPVVVETGFDVKPVLKGFKRLTGLMNLSDDARLTDIQKKKYKKDLESLKELLKVFEDKLK